MQTTEYNDALEANNVNSQYAYEADVAAGQADNFNTLLGTTIPYELAMTGNSNIGGNFAGTTFGLSGSGETPIYYPPVYYQGGGGYGNLNSGGVGGSAPWWAGSPGYGSGYGAGNPYGAVYAPVYGNNTYFSGNPWEPIVNNSLGSPGVYEGQTPIYGPGGQIVGGTVAL